jgi:probable rRNA maturation factor
MRGEIVVLHRQRRWRVDVTRLRHLISHFLEEDLRLSDWRLGIQFVGARTMARLNARWLGHSGSTDVISFNHGPKDGDLLMGDLIISLDDAAAQSRHYHSTPSDEVVRYVVHGILHLRGHDDLEAGSRRLMKHEEDRRLRRLKARFSLAGLVRAARPSRRDLRPGTKPKPRARD